MNDNLGMLMVKQMRLEREIDELSKPVFTGWYILFMIILMPVMLGVVMLLVGVAMVVLRSNQLKKKEDELAETLVKINILKGE